MDIARKTGDF